MDVVQLISDCCLADAEVNTFLYGPASFQNLNDDAQFKVAYLDLLTADVDWLQSGYLHPTYHIKLLIADKSALDYSGLEHSHVITPLYAVMQRIINRIDLDDRTYKIDRRVRITEIINMFDINISGLLVEFDLTVINDLSNCP